MNKDVIIRDLEDDYAVGYIQKSGMSRIITFKMVKEATGKNYITKELVFVTFTTIIAGNKDLRAPNLIYSPLFD